MSELYSKQLRVTNHNDRLTTEQTESEDETRLQQGLNFLRPCAVHTLEPSLMLRQPQGTHKGLFRTDPTSESFCSTSSPALLLSGHKRVLLCSPPPPPTTFMFFCMRGHGYEACFWGHLCCFTFLTFQTLQGSTRPKERSDFRLKHVWCMFSLRLAQSTCEWPLCWQEAEEMLFVRRQRLQSVGGFSLLLLHCLAHVQVKDMSSDSSPAFQRLFFKVQTRTRFFYVH